MTWTPDICLYHEDCYDGFGAAWAVKKRFPDCQMMAVSYGRGPPKVNDQNVLIVDFSYKADTLKTLAKYAESIIVLDHHKTAQAELAGFPDLEDADCEDVGYRLETLAYQNDTKGRDQRRVMVKFDMHQSGAVLAWQFCYPGKPVPILLQYIEDRDLWNWLLVKSKEVNAYVSSVKFDFNCWTDMNEAIENELSSVIGAGTAISAYIERTCEDIIKQARVVEYKGQEVPIIMCPKRFISTAVNMLLKQNPDAPFAMGYCDLADGYREFSLRSTDDRLDVSEVAKAHGGGGHRNAAGFVSSTGTGLHLNLAGKDWM